MTNMLRALSHRAASGRAAEICPAGPRHTGLQISIRCRGGHKSLAIVISWRRDDFGSVARLHDANAMAVSSLSGVVEMAILRRAVQCLISSDCRK